MVVEKALFITIDIKISPAMVRLIVGRACMTLMVENFIARWQGREGGQERANYAMFLTELCTVLELGQPDPADNSHEFNDYAFERAVKDGGRGSAPSYKRIDLYKRNSFILEAKQSRWKGEKLVPGLLPDETKEPGRGRSTANRAWDVLMLNARKQAEDYVRLLPREHDAPPFVLVCDVGHCIEVYANFRRDGKAYDQFPDRNNFRIYLEDLRDERIHDRLRAIWLNPLSLDPSRISAKVTRDIAQRLARVSKALEDAGHPADDVAMFLMRVLFTMFAEDVELLPKKSFQKVLKDCVQKPLIFPSMLEDLWRAMDKGEFTATIQEKVRHFNGEFFKDRRALPLGREEIGELLEAAHHDWKDVEPAIFGTFLEQALDRFERKKLGAHYTPRAYVERLVIATIIDPLRAEWSQVLSTTERQLGEGRGKDAIASVRGFHDRLCEIKVLDPACGTGNFLYVALELMKRLEGEVLDALTGLGGQEALTGLESHTVDPHQFLGLELNPRAAKIAELVLWIGHLQWHFRTKGAAPSDPILKAFHNIVAMDAVLTWDGYPMPRVAEGKEIYPNAKRPQWPEADYIVGNPPFTGAQKLRRQLGDSYTEALWAAHKNINESADFVMYWWDRAADILLRKGSKLKRFGFVTTNSITQVFQRKVTEKYLNAKKPLSLLMAIADHPWTKATEEAASVRIAMSVAEAGTLEGLLLEVTSEAGLESDSPVIVFAEKHGKINSDFTVGLDLTRLAALKSNAGISSQGVKLHGMGFVLTSSEANFLASGDKEADKVLKPFLNGRDINQHSRQAMVIDLFGKTVDEVRTGFPKVYQHILENVKPERDKNNRSTYRDNWWIFGEPRRDLRPALNGLRRFVATTRTSKHRIFQFISGGIIAESGIVVIADDTAFHLGVLSSSIHLPFVNKTCGWLGVGNDSTYNNSLCFDPFPFPIATESQKLAIGTIAEELDAHRKRVLGEHPHLTLTGLYNVLERLKAGAKPADLDAKERAIFDDGLVLLLKEYHEKLDHAVMDAYGWPVDLSDEEILARLVLLNKQRVMEEKRGEVRWLRPDYQIPRFGSDMEKAEQLEANLAGPVTGSKIEKRNFPKADSDQTAIIMMALMAANQPMNVSELAATFKGGQRARKDIEAVLASLLRMGMVSSPDASLDKSRFQLQRMA